MWNNDELLEKRTLHFLSEYEKALDDAKAIVTQRDESGRNAFLSPFEMFPSGPQSVLDQILMKVGRAQGYFKARNWAKADEEIEDVLNYAAFYKVVRRDWEWQATVHEGDVIVGAQTPETVTISRGVPVDGGSPLSMSERPADASLKWFRLDGVTTLPGSVLAWHAFAGTNGAGDRAWALCGYSALQKDCLVRYWDDLKIPADVLCDACVDRIPVERR